MPIGWRMTSGTHPDLAAEHVADLGGLVDDLVGHAEGEVGIAQFGNGPHAEQGRADGRRHDHRLGDRRVEDALLAEQGLQSAVLAGDAAIGAEVFAQRPDHRVAFHFLAQRQTAGFGVGHQCHAGPPMS
jgi:hypothetical protein